METGLPVRTNQYLLSWQVHAPTANPSALSDSVFVKGGEMNEGAGWVVGFDLPSKINTWLPANDNDYRPRHLPISLRLAPCLNMTACRLNSECTVSSASTVLAPVRPDASQRPGLCRECVTSVLGVVKSRRTRWVSTHVPQQATDRGGELWDNPLHWCVSQRQRAIFHNLRSSLKCSSVAAEGTHS